MTWKPRGAATGACWVANRCRCRTARSCWRLPAPRPRVLRVRHGSGSRPAARVLAPWRSPRRCPHDRGDRPHAPASAAALALLEPRQPVRDHGEAVEPHGIDARATLLLHGQEAACFEDAKVARGGGPGV